MSSGISGHVSCKLSNCKNVRRAVGLKLRVGSSTEKGGGQEIKVQEVRKQNTGGRRF